MRTETYRFTAAMKQFRWLSGKSNHICCFRQFSGKTCRLATMHPLQTTDRREAER